MNFFQNTVDPRNAVLVNPDAPIALKTPTLEDIDKLFPSLNNGSTELPRTMGISPEQLAYQEEQRKRAESIKRMQDLHAEVKRQEELERQQALARYEEQKLSQSPITQYLQKPVDPNNAVLVNPDKPFPKPKFPSLSELNANTSPELLRMMGMSPDQLAYQKEKQERAEQIKRMQELHAEVERQEALEKQQALARYEEQKLAQDPINLYLRKSVDPHNAVLVNPNAKFSPSMPIVPVNVSPELLRAAGLSPEQLAYQKEQLEQAERIKRMQDLNAGTESQQALASLIPQEETVEKTPYQQYMEAPKTTDTWWKKAGRAIGNTANAWSDIVDNATTNGMQALLANGLSLYHHLAGNPKDAAYYELMRRARNAESARVNEAAMDKVGSTENLDRGFGETLFNAAIPVIDLVAGSVIGKGLKRANALTRANLTAAERASKAANTIEEKANGLITNRVRQAQKNLDSKRATYDSLKNNPNATNKQIATAASNLTSAQKHLGDTLLEQAQVRAPLLTRAEGFKKSANTSIGAAENAYNNFNKNLGALAALTVPTTLSNIGNVVDTTPSLPEENYNDINNKLSAKAVESSKMPLAESGNSTPYYPPSDELNGENEAISQGYEPAQNKLLSPSPKYPTFNSDGNTEQEVLNNYEPRIYEQYTIPPQAVVNASIPANASMLAPVKTSSVDAPPFYWESPKQEAYVDNKQYNPFIENLRAQTEYLNALRKRTEGLATQQQLSRDAIDRNRRIAEQIRNQNESNPWFWVSNVLGAIPAMRQGVSPFELYERSQLASISADPAYRANQAIIDEVARVSPTELEKLKTQASLFNTNEFYNAARLGEERAKAQNLHNIAVAELGIKDKTAAANVWRWIEEARHNAAMLPIARRKLELEAARVANDADRLIIYEVLSQLKRQELVYKALEAQSKVDANNAKTQQTKAVNQMIEERKRKNQ